MPFRSGAHTSKLIHNKILPYHSPLSPEFLHFAASNHFAGESVLPPCELDTLGMCHFEERLPQYLNLKEAECQLLSQATAYLGHPFRAPPMILLTGPSQLIGVS